MAQHVCRTLPVSPPYPGLRISPAALLSQATIPQESAAEEPPLSVLQLLELPGMAGGGEGGTAAPAAAPASVDDVLAEVDAALAAAEAAMARGRSPSPATLKTLGAGGGLAGGSSSSIVSGDTPPLPPAAGAGRGGNHSRMAHATVSLAAGP